MAKAKPAPKRKPLGLYALVQKHRHGTGISHKVSTSDMSRAANLFLTHLKLKGLSRTMKVVQLSNLRIGSEKLLQPHIVSPILYAKDIPRPGLYVPSDFL